MNIRSGTYFLRPAVPDNHPFAVAICEICATDLLGRQVACRGGVSAEDAKARTWGGGWGIDSARATPKGIVPRPTEQDMKIGCDTSASPDVIE